MTWQIIVAMFIAIPIILLPVALVWYLNSGRIYASIKGMMERREARQGEGREVAVVEAKEPEK